MSLKKYRIDFITSDFNAAMAGLLNPDLERMSKAFFSAAEGFEALLLLGAARGLWVVALLDDCPMFFFLGET